MELLSYFTIVTAFFAEDKEQLMHILKHGANITNIKTTLLLATSLSKNEQSIRSVASRHSIYLFFQVFLRVENKI